MTKHVLAGRAPGMTLIEIVIGIALFALASMPIIGLFGRGASYTQANADHIAAMHRASSYMRGLLSLPFRDVPLGRPVTLDQTFGSATDNQIHIPAAEVIDGNEFNYRLRIDNVVRDQVSGDFWFEVKPGPGTPARMTAFRKFIRIEFEVSWTSKLTQQLERFTLFLYKGDLG